MIRFMFRKRPYRIELEPGELGHVLDSREGIWRFWFRPRFGGGWFIETDRLPGYRQPCQTLERCLEVAKEIVVMRQALDREDEIVRGGNT